jgi:hypothetical protein
MHLVIGGDSAGCLMAARLSDAPGNGGGRGRTRMRNVGQTNFRNMMPTNVAALSVMRKVSRTNTNIPTIMIAEMVRQR